jgi:hypothetical protein
MANNASALGEAIGHLIEAEVQRIVRESVTDLECYVDTGGERPGIRNGKKVLLVNDTGNSYQIDTVVEDSNGNPIVLLECKYIRYKKHNRDKASWTCVAHYKIRTTYPTVKKSIAVLIGDWTAPSKKLMKSFGVDIIEIPFQILKDILKRYGVEFHWEEGDVDTPESSLRAFRNLQPEQHMAIARECVAHVSEKLKKVIRDSILSGEIRVRNIQQIELLLKTDQEEFVLKKFTTIQDAASYLLTLTSQRSDVGDIIHRT